MGRTGASGRRRRRRRGSSRPSPASTTVKRSAAWRAPGCGAAQLRLQVDRTRSEPPAVAGRGTLVAVDVAHLGPYRLARSRGRRPPPSVLLTSDVPRTRPSTPPTQARSFGLSTTLSYMRKFGKFRSRHIDGEIAEAPFGSCSERLLVGLHDLRAAGDLPARDGCRRTLPSGRQHVVAVVAEPREGVLDERVVTRLAGVRRSR